MTARANYESWLKSTAVDEATKEELRAIEGDEKEIETGFIKSWSLERAVCAALWGRAATG